MRYKLPPTTFLSHLHLISSYQIQPHFCLISKKCLENFFVALGVAPAPWQRLCGQKGTKQKPTRGTVVIARSPLQAYNIVTDELVQVPSETRTAKDKSLEPRE